MTVKSFFIAFLFSTLAIACGEKKQASTPSTPAVSSEDVIKKIESDMIFVQGGELMLGCPEEPCDSDTKPLYKANVPDFYINKFEITSQQWQTIMGEIPERATSTCPQCAMNWISWTEIQVFIQKLNEKTGKKYRLPTETEWEYAARGGQATKGFKYAGSNNIEEVAWYDDNKNDPVTQPVGQKKPNELGLYDMTGNVYEWCSDSNATKKNIICSSSWGTYPEDSYLWSRSKLAPNEAHSNLGFRLALSK